MATLPLAGSFAFHTLDQAKQCDYALGYGPGQKPDAFRKNFECQITAKTRLMSGEVDTDGSKKKYIELDLYGTQVGPQEEPATSDSLMGPFLDRVVVTVEPKHPGVIREWDEPHSAANGHVSTYSISFNATASAGTFGEQGITNVGAGFAVSDGSSVEFSDWNMENHTTGAKVVHEYFMTAAGRRPYNRNDPGSGVFPPMSDRDLGTNIINIGEAITDQGLATPPHLSLSNFPIVTHALWSTTEALGDSIQFSVVVQARFVTVGVRQGLLATYSRSSTELIWETYFTAPLGDIRP